VNKLPPEQRKALEEAKKKKRGNQQGEPERRQAE
jgi:hypothetical protein